jgi:uroporphyrinogen III methyltransferase/synthase
MEDMSPLQNSLSNIEKYNWIIFTSQNAINIFFEELFAFGKDSRALGNTKIAVIGRASGDELKQYGLIPDIVPKKFVAESLLEEFEKHNVANQKILLPCSADARMTLKDGLTKMGAVVDRIHIYNAAKPSHIDEAMIKNIKDADMITFTSSSTVTNFFSICPETNAAIASIGPVTTDTIIKHGFKPSVVAEEYTIEGLVEGVVGFYG